MLEYVDLLKAWTVTLGVAVLHTAVLAFNVGRLRGVHKSWATEEDKAKNGGIVGDAPEVARANAAHRNQLENLPLFIAASVLFVVVASVAQFGTDPLKPNPTDRDFIAGIILFVVWTFCRIGHSIAYINAIQPWRSVCFGLSATTVFVIVLYAIINVFVNTPNDH